MQRRPLQLPPYFSTVEVAALFCVSESTVLRWAATGKIPSLLTIGGHRRYPKPEVLALLERQARGHWVPTPEPAPAVEGDRPAELRLADPRVPLDSTIARTGPAERVVDLTEPADRPVDLPAGSRQRG